MKIAWFLILLGTLASALAEPVELTVTPERRAVHPDSDPETVLQIEVSAKPSKVSRAVPVNLALVLDRSGSMTGAKLEKARQAASMAIDQLSAGDTVSLVVYDDEVQVLVERQKIGDGKKIKRSIEAIEPGGATALFDGVKTGAAQLPEKLEDDAVNRVILLSDGLANVGPDSPRDLAKLGRDLRAKGISVSTVGLGDDYNETLMAALAESSGANYYYVQDAEKLPGIFREELALAQSIAARKVRITIELAKDVEPSGVLGEEDISFEGQTLTIPLEDLPSGQTRRFLVSCRVPEDAKDSVRLGNVRLDYVDASSGDRSDVEKTADVEIAETAEKSGETIVPEVAQNRAVVANRLAKEKAVALADQGLNAEAASVLRAQNAANKSLPASARNSLLEAEEINLLQAADALDNDSFSKADRKRIDFQNYQDRNQKR